ncbi:putative GH43/DUF377 family glycosyl hydrolase [Puniceicoccus vermicola]
MLIDLENPSQIVGICPEPLLAPELEHELKGSV